MGGCASTNNRVQTASNGAVNRRESSISIRAIDGGVKNLSNGSINNNKQSKNNSPVNSANNISSSSTTTPTIDKQITQIWHQIEQTCTTTKINNKKDEHNRNNNNLSLQTVRVFVS